MCARGKHRGCEPEASCVSDGFDDVVTHLRTDRPIVCADPGLAALPPDARPAHEGGPSQTGALVVDVADTPPLAEDVERFLAAGPPPVYAGFGSMGGARRGCRHRGVRRGHGSKGGEADPRRRLGRHRAPARSRDRDVDERVLFIDGAPHARLFPRCAFVVHHGGAGTTTAAARAGVPQLVVAHAADQFFWGERVHSLGIGPPWLQRSRFNAAAVGQRLAGDWSAYADRARALARDLATIDGNALTAQALENEARENEKDART